MQTSASQVEDQIFGEEGGGSNHTFSVRNIAIIGTFLLFIVSGTIYWYRKEIFGVSSPPNTNIEMAEQKKVQVLVADVEQQKLNTNKPKVNGTGTSVDEENKPKSEKEKKKLNQIQSSLL